MLTLYGTSSVSSPSRRSSRFIFAFLILFGTIIILSTLYLNEDTFRLSDFSPDTFWRAKDSEVVPPDSEGAPEPGRVAGDNKGEMEEENVVVVEPTESVREPSRHFRGALFFFSCSQISS